MNSISKTISPVTREVRIAVIQFCPTYKEVVENRNALLCLLENAVDRNPQILVCPEMCTSGYIFSKRSEVPVLAEDAFGETFKQFSRFCKKHRVYLAYGFPEKDGERMYNSQNLIGPNGKLLKTYRKKNLFCSDQIWASPGRNSYQTLETEYGKIGMGICMDLNTNEFTAFHERENTDLILFSANWLFSDYEFRIEYWIECCGEFTGAIAFSNRIGKEFDKIFCGNSCLINCGKLIARAPQNSEFCLVTSLFVP